MDDSSGIYEEAESDPMLVEQFNVALKATQVRIPELIAACRDVMVEGLSTAEASRRHNIENSTTISRAVKTIRDKWDEICAEQGWTFMPVAVPTSWAKLLVEIQREQLDRYTALQDEGRKRK